MTVAAPVKSLPKRILSSSAIGETVVESREDVMVQFFMDELASSLVILSSATDRKDFLRVASVAHRISKHAAIIEAHRLSAVATHLEQAARSGVLSSVRGMISEFQFACSQFEAAMSH